MNPYKIYIMQYAKREVQAREVFLGDPHNDTEVGMFYFMWAITNGEHTVVVDMGFTEQVCNERGREWTADPGANLDAIGIDPAKVEHVIVTHMHYDHVGNYAMFPNATFYLQDDEMAFWTGRYVKYKAFNVAINVEDIVAMVRLNYDGRISFCQGTREILPGITVHKVGGHTKAMQIVEVATSTGTAVLASDASHYYHNYQEYVPFSLLHDIPGMLDGFELMRELADREELILPGHDPEVMNRYPAVAEGIAIME